MCWSWSHLFWLGFGLAGDCVSEDSDERCPIHDGGSLAGKDSHEASSTSSQSGCNFFGFFASSDFVEFGRFSGFLDAISLRLPRLFLSVIQEGDQQNDGYRHTDQPEQNSLSHEMNSFYGRRRTLSTADRTRPVDQPITFRADYGSVRLEINWI
jgi:hypothetical protein